MAAMSDRQKLAELGAQLKTLKIDCAGQIGELMTAVGECAEKALRKRSVEHDELLRKHLKLQKDYDALTARLSGGVDVKVDRSYVVVLVDAHSHKFKDDLVIDKSSGGLRAAQLVRDSVQQYMTENVPHAKYSRIESQVYANLKSLSLDAWKKKLADENVRSLAPFTSNFSRMEYFDFIDVQDEGIVQQRIKRRMMLCVMDPSCKHVFLAAGGSIVYTQTIQQLGKHKEMITLIKGERQDQGLLGLGISKVSFLQVFRKTEASHAATAKSNACFGNDKDHCHGSNCKYHHVDHVSGSTKPLDLPIVALPGLIPVNANDERLDLYMRPPSQAQWAVLEARNKVGKPCYDFHVRHGCTNGGCGFDHSLAVELDALYCIQYVLKEMPCHTGSHCRRLDCRHGHVCQKVNCGGGSNCKIKRELHISDLRVSKWVKPKTDEEEAVVQSGSCSIGDDLIDLLS